MRPRANIHDGLEARCGKRIENTSSVTENRMVGRKNLLLTLLSKRSPLQLSRRCP